MVQEFASIWPFLLLFLFLFRSRYSTSFIPLNGIWLCSTKNAPSPQQQQLSPHIQPKMFLARGGGDQKRRKGHVLEMSPLIEALFSTIQEKGEEGLKDIFSVAAATRKQPTECIWFPEIKLLKIHQAVLPRLWNKRRLIYLSGKMRKNYVEFCACVLNIVNKILSFCKSFRPKKVTRK